MIKEITSENDIFGLALLDFANGEKDAEITVISSLTEDDSIPVSYLFRGFDAMPKIEQKALELASGKILDVGAGAGSHALYLQQKGLEIVALDSSKGALKIAHKRGVKKTIHTTILKYKEPGFDTILLLMNGTGIFETLKKTRKYLKHLNSILEPGGQILIDSTDIKYMFEEEDGSFWMDLNREYYGEVSFQLEYKGQKSVRFEWLYLDFERLTDIALKTGFSCELILEGENADYLAKLVKK